MDFSRYLYSKVKSANSKFILLLLTPDEVSFLNRNHIEYFRKGDVYSVDSDRIKKLFCNC